MLTVLSVLMAIWPHVYIAGYFVLVLLDDVPDSMLFIWFGIYFLIGFVTSISYCSAAWKASISDAVHKTAQRNMLIKLVNLPSDLVITLYFIGYMVDLYRSTGSCMGPGPFVLIIFLLPYLLTRLIMQISTMEACKKMLAKAISLSDYRITITDCNIQLLLHLVPFADVVSAVWVNQKLKQMLPDDSNP